MKAINTYQGKDQTFQYLKALLIIMVIDDHVSTRIGLLSSIFPYNSFYMPMFLFISGYFYKKKGIWHALKRYTKRLLIPYQIWSFVGLFVSWLLMLSLNLQWYKPITVSRLLNSFFYGPLSSATGPSWFAIMLFWVSIIYTIIYHNDNNFIIDCIYTMVLIGISIIMIILSRNGFLSYEYQYIDWRVWLCRTGFYVFFFHLGGMFHKYIEKSIKQIRKIYICSLCIIINVIFVLLKGDNINFYSTQNMNGFKSIILPYVTSITGIIFWYTVFSFVSEKIGAIRIVNLIADNTFTIMCCHLIFTNIPNLFIYINKCATNNSFVDFNNASFMMSAWYKYSPNSRIIGFFLGIIGSVSLCVFIKYISKRVCYLRERKNRKEIS